MPIEPHHVITVSRRPIVGADRPKTLAEYQAPIIARFGRLPSWPELAHIESTPRSFASYGQAAPGNPRVLSLKAALAAKSEASRQSILDALIEPMTAADVALAVQRDARGVRRSLILLRDQGRVTGTRVKTVMVWQRAQVAA